MTFCIIVITIVFLLTLIGAYIAGSTFDGFICTIIAICLGIVLFILSNYNPSIETKHRLIPSILIEKGDTTYIYKNL